MSMLFKDNLKVIQENQIKPADLVLAYDRLSDRREAFLDTSINIGALGGGGVLVGLVTGNLAIGAVAFMGAVASGSANSIVKSRISQSSKRRMETGAALESHFDGLLDAAGEITVATGLAKDKAVVAEAVRMKTEAKRAQSGPKTFQPA